MGQYYKPCLLSEDENKKVDAWLSSYDYDNGSKLMEHSYLKNEFVNTVEKLLEKGGAWFKRRIVWAGDYADYEPDTKYIDEDGRECKKNLYDFCDDENQIYLFKSKSIRKKRFFINHSKQLYVDSTKVPVSYTGTDKKGKIWESRIHPLPLLTCEGNGQGGGDYRGESSIVGTWARDIISIEPKAPKGYTELIFDLVE